MILLEGATIVTSEKEAQGSILIEEGKIADVFYCESEDYNFRIFKAKNAAAACTSWQEASMLMCISASRD